MYKTRLIRIKKIAMSNVGVGLPFPLIKNNNVLFFSFIEEIKFNTWELFNLPRCPLR
jgi:hypothetical protein